jgi:hypothetical protein
LNQAGGSTGDLGVGRKREPVVDLIDVKFKVTQEVFAPKQDFGVAAKDGEQLDLTL